MKVVCIIQARVNSLRLPGKALMQLGGNTVLGNVIDRVHKSKHIDGVVVATPDKEIIKEAIKNGAHYFVGSEDNVLERYYKTARFYGADKIVRITSDCPYIMPDIIDELILKQVATTSTYASNVKSRTYPKGLDAEVFTMGELQRAYEVATMDYEKEHVTPYIIKQAMQQYSLEDNENYSDIRLTLDTQTDYHYLTDIYKQIGDVYTYSEAKKYFNKPPILT